MPKEATKILKVVLWGIRLKSEERSGKGREVKLLSRVWLSASPRTIASPAPPSMGFSRQEYWSGLPLPPPGDLPTQGSNLGLPAAGRCFTVSQQGSPGWGNCISFCLLSSWAFLYLFWSGCMCYAELTNKSWKSQQLMRIVSCFVFFPSFIQNPMWVGQPS